MARREYPVINEILHYDAYYGLLIAAWDVGVELSSFKTAAEQATLRGQGDCDRA